MVHSTNTPKPVKEIYITRNCDHNKRTERDTTKLNKIVITLIILTITIITGKRKKRPLKTKCNLTARVAPKPLKVGKVECRCKTEKLMTSIDQVSG